MAFNQQGRPVLRRYSKRFGPGDIDGAGTRNLLGRPSFEKVVTLVRETAQNSWDARDRDLGHVDFVMRLRQATPEVLTLLRGCVFADVPPADSLALGEHLYSDDPIWLLEITDRGTRGLGGPTRNDIAVPGDVRTDFADFVLTLGAPRDLALGGGTYGFGKTIAYTASHTSTALIWTRCRLENGEFEHRLIASGMGNNYIQDGAKFTGRHWWGATTVNDSIAPLVGEPAKALGEALYVRGFEAEECGTSLLLIAPDFGETPGDNPRPRSPREYVKALAEAALAHLWPKLVVEDGRDAMSIKIFLEDEDLSPPAVEDDPVLRHFVTSLRIVRALQRGQKPPPEVISKHWDIIDGRGRGKLLGHLAVTAYQQTPEVVDRLRELFPDDEGRGRHLALMRHEAELVVRYQSLKAHAQEGWGWAAVFKPIAAFDDAFADAEPPSHDDWHPNAVKNPEHKSPVNVSLTHTRKRLEEWASPKAQAAAAPMDGARSSVALSEALGSLMGDIQGTGSGMVPAASIRAAKLRPRKARPKVVGHDLQPHGDDGFTRWVIDVELDASEPTSIEADPTVHTAGRSERDPEVCSVLGWETALGNWVADSSLTLEPGERCRLHLRVLDDLAIDAGLKVVP